MVDGAGLENQSPFTRTRGSNPLPTAKMVKIIPFESLSFSSNVYLIKAKKVTLIDVGAEPENLLTNLKKEITLPELAFIILTHSHPDHTLALPSLLKVTKAKVVIHEQELKSSIKSIMGFSIPRIKPDVLLKGGERLNLGDFSLEVIHTPGHTAGSICLYQEGILFSGDTIFAGGNIGRTDLGGNNKDLSSSIEKLTRLPVEIVYPGHGESIQKNTREEILSSLRLAEGCQ